MGTITGKFHQNPLKTAGGVAETKFPDGRTDGLTDERTDGRIHFYSPLRLTSGDNKVKGQNLGNVTSFKHLDAVVLMKPLQSKIKLALRL